MAAARVVLNRLDLAVRLGLDVLVEYVVLGQLPQDALLPFVYINQPSVVHVPRAFLTVVLFAANLAQKHAAQLLPPVEVFWVVLFDQAIVVALSLIVGFVVELLLGRAIAQNAPFEVDDVLAVRLASEDGPELGQGLLGHGAP